MQTTDVFLLSAGLGTRLRPLTDTLPKPLVAVDGVPLIERHLIRLAAQGFRRVMINLHYLPDQIRAFVGDGSRWSLEVEYSFEPTLLDTGGGIKKIEPWIRSPELLVLNSDSVFDDSLELAALCGRGGQMTLLVGPDRGFTKLYLNPDGTLRQLGGEASGAAVNYLGAMSLQSSLTAGFPEGPFSITTGVIPGILSAGGVVHTHSFSGFWSDVGTPERLELASKYFRGQT